MQDKNPLKISEMFDEIASYYDYMNNKISLGSHYIIKILALKQLELRENMMILDACCGTGDFVRILSKSGLRVIGLDFSKEMIKIAKSKNPHGVFIQGDVTDLAFGENEFDVITIGFGLRNVENRQKALEEIYRVLKPNGQFLHLDFGEHNFLSKIFDFIVPYIVKFCKKNLSDYEYLINTKNEYPQPDEIIEEFENAGFKFVKRKDFFFGAISVQIMQK